MTTPFDAKLSRRGVVAAALGVASGALPPRRAWAADRPWIPSNPLLADLPRLMELASVPGLVMAAVENGEVAWSRALGSLSATTQSPVQSDSVFPAASLGKPVFGYVVLRLVDEGKIDLDRPLGSYFRPDDLPADPNSDRVTARHVLSHSTGYRNWRGRADARFVPDAAPGTRFGYSGEGFFWLGRVVETVTGRGVDRVMRDYLFDPAGMPRSTYAWSADHDAWSAHGHDNRGQPATMFSRNLGNRLLPIAAKLGKPLREWTASDVFRAMPQADSTLPLQPNFAIPNVAGSLLTTAPEYARFLALVMERRARAAWEISEQRRQEMLTPQVEVKPGGLSWGLGWGLERSEGGQLLWHWGDNGAFKAFTIGDPRLRRAFVIFTNGTGGQKVYERVIRDAVRRDLPAFLWI